MTQPAVTFQIKQLEEHFNIRLFDRGPGHISLTAAGAMVFEYAERILALSSEPDVRMKDLAGQVAGPLLIGASMTIADYLLPQVLGEFNVRFPRWSARGRAFSSGCSPMPRYDPYGVFGVLYSTSFWNGFQTVS